MDGVCERAAGVLNREAVYLHLSGSVTSSLFSVLGDETQSLLCARQLSTELFLQHFHFVVF